MTTSPTSTSSPDLGGDPAWIRRIRAPRVLLPQWARGAPQRCLYASNGSGVFELHAWDRDTDTHRQVTDRPNGTRSGRLSRDGEWVWWFNDTDGDEWGTWLREPFGGGSPPSPAVPGLEPAYDTGLHIGARMVVVGRSTDDGTQLHLAVDSVPAAVLYSSEHDAYLAGLSDDETLLALLHSEHGDSRHPALRIMRVPDGTTVLDLWDGPGKGLHSAAFCPVAGDTRLLVGHERRGRPELLILDARTGTQEELPIDLPGEIEAVWYPDGAGLLVFHQHEARSELYRYDVATAGLFKLDTPSGVILDATARPDGDVEFMWSSAAQPSAVRSLTGSVILRPPGEAAPESVRVEDAWVDGPGGPVHALVSRPDGAGPHAAVFFIHGGPASSDRDMFRPDRAAYVDAGYCVVHVNYRGSTGYGSTWRDALEGRPGLTELEDIAAVRDWAVATGMVDPARCVIRGGSWGGYLTLLALGTQPDAWAAGVAVVPVADYVAAYEDEMEPLRAYDRSLFGGSPQDVPHVYEQGSPITYVDAVRAPVFILAGENDPRCPIRQIENYIARLTDRGAPPQVHRFDAGHGSLVIDEQIRQVGLELDFCRQHVTP